MGKKTNWTAAEDQALCRAWLQASAEPPAQATPPGEARAATFWAQVHRIFHGDAAPAPVDRPLNGLKIRWTRINRDVQRFAVVHAQVLEAHGFRSDGTTGGADVLDGEGEAPLLFDEAKALFEKERAARFLFEPCWRLLRFSPKWVSNLASNMGVAVHSSPSAAIASSAAALSSSAAAAMSSAAAHPSAEFLGHDRSTRMEDAISADAFREAPSLHKRRATAFLDELPQEPLEHLSGLTGAIVEELRRRNELLEEQNALALFRLDADLAQHEVTQAYVGMLRQRYLKKMRLAIAMEASADVHSSATVTEPDEEEKTAELEDPELRV